MRNAELDIIPPVTLEQLIGKGQDLPSLPEIYLRVSEQLEDENSSVQQIGDTVQNDPAISTRVLKMVNSAYYGLPNQVSSIAQAVSLLGRERLKHILIGSVLRGVSGSTVSRPRSSRGNWRGIPLRSGSPRPCSPPDCCTTSASCC
ncbi:MAG: HDOD domain-containing protein [Gammaproteobacteria bacterium]|nr:HDOD domain-containing protein [Gammaproteobacteria bacterium]